jgi:hypothetical protein
VGWSRKPIAWPGITGGGEEADRASVAFPRGIRELVSKLLANAISEIAICLMRLSNLSRVTGLCNRIDQIIGRL